MKNITALVNFMITTLQTDPAVQSARTIETSQLSESQFAVKIRAQLAREIFLQIRVYRNGSHMDYSYQVFRGDIPLMRWDNKEHFPNLENFPHHFHHPAGMVVTSPLSANPENDLPEVLVNIKEWINKGEGLEN
jgi:hypothetical protein